MADGWPRPSTPPDAVVAGLGASRLRRNWAACWRTLMSPGTRAHVIILLLGTVAGSESAVGRDAGTPAAAATATPAARVGLPERTLAPTAAVWRARNSVQLVWFTLEDGQRFVSLPREDGCLALLRPGHSPIVGNCASPVATTAVRDADVADSWTLKGKVEDPEERPAPATITAEQPSGSDTGSDTGSCRGMLSARCYPSRDRPRWELRAWAVVPAGRWR
jgi:hypothetical protein